MYKRIKPCNSQVKTMRILKGQIKIPNNWEILVNGTEFCTAFKK